MTAKDMFQVFARYYEALKHKKTEIIEVRKTPAWCKFKDHTYTVHFRTVDMDIGYALMTGHGVSYEDAYKMLFDYYMKKKNLTWQELQLRAVAYGLGI